MKELTVFTRKVYEYFAYRIYGKKLDFRQVNGSKSVKTVKEFSQTMLDRYGVAAGPSFVWFYIIYQFDRFYLTEFKPASYVNFITPSMIFGSGAIEKFGDRKTIDALTIKSPWMQEHDLSMQEFVRLYGYTFTTTMEKVDRNKVERELMNYVDPIKRVTATTNQGMDLCLDMTDLYNEKDPSCKICPYSKECKLKLKEVNPQIYNLRNYE